MSIHWTLIAGFLYAEIAAVLLLILPIISAKRWKSLFHSNFMKAIGGQSFFYFCVLILLLVLAFLDAIREMRKYSGDFERGETATHGHLDVEIQHHMRLFRAQRNFYISGFALFLFLVLRRLVSLLLHQATVEASNDAAIRQAASASAAASALLEGDAPVAANTTALKKQLEEAEKERDSALKKAEMLQCQAEATSEEYDRLLAEHSALQKQVEKGDKKDD